jgi:NAD-dependent SIR2 family protein deacetylase
MRQQKAIRIRRESEKKESSSQCHALSRPDRVLFGQRMQAEEINATKNESM